VDGSGCTLARGLEEEPFEMDQRCRVVGVIQSYWEEYDRIWSLKMDQRCRVVGVTQSYWEEYGMIWYVIEKKRRATRVGVSAPLWVVCHRQPEDLIFDLEYTKGFRGLGPHKSFVRLRLKERRTSFLLKHLPHLSHTSPSHTCHC
jgi:hypothetical protein